MKTKKLISVLSLIIFGLGIVLSLGFLRVGINAQASGKEILQIAEADEKESNWLLIEKEAEEGSTYEPVKTEVNAGVTTGYGKFELNKQNVELTAKANVGLKLVGWNVTYSTTELADGAESEKDVTVFLHNSRNLPETSYTIESESYDEKSVELTMNYLDSDGDGYFDAGTFKISNIFSDMTVDAVFDYIYYKVEITNIFDKLDAKNFSHISMNGETIYYENSSAEEDVVTYSNAFYELDNRVYYYSKVYGDGARYYTLHMVGGVEQKIELSRGAYELGQEVDFNLNVNIQSRLENSVNIDIRSVNLIEDDASLILSNDKAVGNFAVIYKEQNEYDENVYNRTTRVEIGLKIVETKNKTQTLNFEYHNLYVATLNVAVDGVNFVDGNLYIQTSINYILELLSENVNYYHSRINLNQYFVKNFNQNENNQTFELYCNPSIYGESVNYLYYTFDNMSLNGTQINDNHVRYADITNNFEINIQYTSAKYSIEFEPYLKISDTSLIKITDPEFNLDAKMENLVRGTNFVCGESETAKNVGYKFYGYSLSSEEFANNSNLEVSIDYTRPENLVVLMIYEYAQFDLQLSNYDSIALLTDIMPIESLTLTINDLETISFNSSSLRAGSNAAVGKTLALYKALNLGDKISLAISLNEGFDASKFEFFIENFNGEKQYSTNGVGYSFVITQNFISSLFEDFYADNSVVVKVNEFYARYNFSYYIDPSFDTILDKEIIMAEINLETDEDCEAVIDKVYFGTESEGIVQKFNVSNLKLYETIKLTSKTKTYQTYTYNFVRFTADNKTSLDSTNEGDVHSYTATINKNDIWVKVVYVAKSSILTIVTNKAQAFDLAEGQSFEKYLTITQANKDVQIDGNNQVKLVEGPFGVRFKDVQNPFNFGFRFLNYKLINGQGSVDKEVDTTTLSSPYIVGDFNIVGNDENYILELNFEAIIFEINVRQFGRSFSEIGQTKTYNGELLSFEDNQFASLTVENGLELKFNLPEGTYVNKFYFVQNNNLIEENDFALPKCNGGIYSCSFSVQDAVQYLLVYGKLTENKYVVDVRVDYEIYNFSITVNYQFLASKGEFRDSQIKYPNLRLDYRLDNHDYSFDVNGNKTLVLINVPYGVRPTVRLTNALPVGYISIYNWGYSNTASPYTMGKDNGLSYITLQKITTNENLIYTIEYQAIKVKVEVDGNLNMGSPLAKKNSVELFDNLQISMNANKNLGYKFEYMYYYSPYNLGAESWENDKENLYVFEDNAFVPVHDEFDESLTYYTINFYTGEMPFVDEEINFNDYAVVNDSINFYVVYGYINIHINNLSEDLFVDGEYETSLRPLNIFPENYANYLVLKYKNGTFVPLEEGETVTVLDTVRIYVKLNSASVKNITNDETQEFDLARGLRIVSVAYGIKFKAGGEYDGENYNYNLQFNINDIISNVDDEDNLTISYNYVVDNKSVEMTTNIKSESFYFSNGVTKFLMSYRGSENFSGQAGDSSSKTSLDVQMQFLGAAQFSYEFRTAEGNYFRITKINYLFNGEILDQSQYKNYGIEIVENAENFYVRFLDDLQIILQVEPIINFYNISNYGRHEAVLVEPDENGDYYLTKEFLCEMDGTGAAQELSKGSSNANIVSDKSILDCMIIEFFNANNEKVDPINVGMYIVKISFKNQGSSYDWINEIELNYNVYLEITKLNIIVSYNTSFTDSQEYCGENRIDFSRVRNYLIIQDDFGGTHLRIDYNANSKIQFVNFPVCYITKTNELGIEIPTSDAGTGLNISISGLKLISDDFNNNFSLKFQQDILQVGDNQIQDILVIKNKFSISKKKLTILGIQVYDKVYDGNSTVDYDIVNWSFGEKLIEADYGLVSVDFSKLIFSYADNSVGNNKLITVDCKNALIDIDANNPRIQNYNLVVDNYYAKIYPYATKEIYLAGVGNVYITNPRGLMDKNDEEKSYRQYVSLIPIGAELEVDVIYPNSNEYENIYPYINKYLSNFVVFGYGYKLQFVVGNMYRKIDNNLYLNLPRVSKLSGAIWLTGQETGNLNYSVNGNNIVIDLSQIPTSLEAIIILQSKQFLTWWQICLIILLILLIILLIVLIFIHERRKKKRKDLLNEKI